MEVLGLQVQCSRLGTGCSSQAGLGWAQGGSRCVFLASGINICRLDSRLCRGVVGGWARAVGGPQLWLLTLLRLQSGDWGHKLGQDSGQQGKAESAERGAGGLGGASRAQASPMPCTAISSPRRAASSCFNSILGDTPAGAGQDGHHQVAPGEASEPLSRGSAAVLGAASLYSEPRISITGFLGVLTTPAHIIRSPGLGRALPAKEREL